MNTYLAVDIGASTMRMILSWKENGVLKLREVYRKPNVLQKRSGHLCWDLAGLFDGIVEGLKQCRAVGVQPVTMGIDTWGVDYVLLDGSGRILGDSIAYRDSRTHGMDALLEKELPFEDHYRICGIARQPFNTVYQLMAQFRAHPAHKNAAAFLMVPDYLNFLLTGVKKNEYTNSSTTAMLDAHTKNWSPEILTAAGIPAHLFAQKPCDPGSVIGTLKPELVQELGFDLTVLAPATHDTGSAFAAVPARDENAVYLSSGTWSLLGVENHSPMTDPAAMRSGFTNEGGCGGKIRFLKNIMGLWILQSLRRECGEQYSFGELAALAQAENAYPGRIDVNDERFLAPQNMLAEITAALREVGFEDPSFAQILACVHHSLAQSYGCAIRDLEERAGRRFTSLNIVGGGCQNAYLNRLTAQETGLPVFAGPTEGTALGNLLVQMLKNGEFPSLQAARNALAVSFEIKEVKP